MAWPKVMPVVWIEWEDSCSHSGWQDADDACRDHAAGPMICQSVGWLLHQDAQQLVVAQSRNEHGQVADRIAIPRVAVRRIREGTPARRWRERVSVPGGEAEHAEESQPHDAA